ncbi:MAG TPA: AAA family ATPase [Candidatus Paceibacterota bacterium]
MRLERIELSGFKSFAKKTTFVFNAPVVAIVGPNGSGKSNVAEACRWVLGEQSLKSLRGKRGEDFIWHGSPAVGRAGQAAVAIIFDNQPARFPLAAAAVEIRREVQRDGTNNYFINQAGVRLKDLTETLHQAALGPSGYHIISQGEADKILTTNPTDRREIVETALGLRLYEWQLAEAEKKLVRTSDNLRQAESLRREIAPHLRFLKKEMEKIEQARDWRQTLKQLAFDYFCAEKKYLAGERARLAAAETASRLTLAGLTDRRSQLERTGGPETGVARQARGQLAAAEQKLRQAVEKRENLSRQLGRAEGLLEVKTAAATAGRQTVAGDQVNDWAENLETAVEQVKDSGDLNLWRAAFSKIKQIAAEMRKLIGWTEAGAGAAPPNWEKEITALTAALAAANQEINRTETEIKTARQTLEQEAAARGAADRALIESKFAVTAEQAKLDAVLATGERWKILQADFDRALAEVTALTDREFLESIKTAPAEPAGAESADRTAQTDRARQIERLKIRLEQAGGGSGEMATEYQAAAAREEHLAREVADLKTSMVSLEQVAKDLKQKIDRDFRDGLRQINLEFQNFFELLFGGGRVELSLNRAVETAAEELIGEETKEPARAGLDIAVNLPRKRIRGLEMLSGGERSLTSIALLFALSRVQPPPFMILDETDAALDEANSKKYGDMVEQLAKETQLVLITHNRETMSRAGLIYGVTMGSDGISRLLSIKFDEAVSYAKT